MANGTKVGAHGRARRNDKPRVSSPQGRAVRMAQRAATTGHTTDKFKGGFRRAGSANPRKVGRG